MGLQPFYGKGSHPVLWAGSRAARGKITVSGVPNCQNYFEMSTVYTVYKCGRGPHKTTWWAAGWRPMV